jgi:hypothetical protein
MWKYGPASMYGMYEGPGTSDCSSGMACMKGRRGWEILPLEQCLFPIRFASTHLGIIALVSCHVL